jgi:N-acyl-D-aspartate/D-glutamate deacylase
MLLIENGLYFDGLGHAPRLRNLLVDEGVVKEVSAEPIEAPGAERIDAQGKWVMPGFLDTHTHYDAELLVAPGLSESVRHGVTTVLVGSCSLSTIYSTPEDCADVFSRVEALPHKHVRAALEKHKTWDSPAGYIKALEDLPLGPNVMSFAGHSDLRVRVMGLERAVDSKSKPTEEEQLKMEAMLEEALDEGLLGLSTMTNPWDKVGGERFRSSRLPSTYASWSEYRRFNTILRKKSRILQSAPNITTKANVFLFMAGSAAFFGLRKALKTALITAADTKANPLLARALTGMTSVINRLFGANLRWQSVPMPFEVYADGMDLVVFEEFGAGEAALHLADELERNELLQDKAYRRRFRKDYEKKWSPRVWHRNFYDATIVDAPDQTLRNKSFGEVADERGLHPVDAFLDLVVEHGTKLRWKTTIANHRPDQLEKLVAHPSVQISFADSGAHVRNMAFYNFPLYFLRTIKRSIDRDEALMPIEKAVGKVTGDLGEWYGVKAGTIAVGDRADIAIVNPEGLDDALDDYAEAPMPCFDGMQRMVRRNDKAVSATIIAGKVAYQEGSFSPGYGETERYGSFLRVSN